MKFFTSIIFVLLLITIPVVLFAASGINKQIAYQAVLKTDAGVKAADGDYDIIFKIYDAATGGTLLWTGTHTTANGNAVTLTDGVFSVLLGSGTGNAMTVDFTTDTLYLAVKIESDSEMTPRKRIAAAGYAFNSDTLDGINSLSFLRSDDPDTIASTSVSTILTITQSGTGDILNLFDGATEILTVLDGGNVGIGTSTALENILTVNGGIGLSSTTPATTTNALYNQGGTLFWDGGVTIGTSTSPTYKLEIDGGDVNTIAGGYRDAGTCVSGTCASDRALKNNISPIDGALYAIQALNPVSFEFNDAVYGSGIQHGYIAQEIDTVFPELVGTSAEGYRTIKYGLQLQTYTTAAVKELAGLVLGNITFATNTASSALYISGDGKIGIGTTMPNEALVVSGNVAATGFINLSTEESKTNIVHLGNQDYVGFLNKLANTPITTYNYLQDASDEPLRLGLIAEEAPVEILSTDGKGIDLYKFTSFLAGSIKAQQLQITSLMLGTDLQGNPDGNLELQTFTVASHLVFEGDITVRGQATFNEDTVGQAKILAGDSGVPVNFGEEYKNTPVVTVTPLGIHDVNYGISNISTIGFTIEIDPSQTRDIIFNWHSFASGAGRIHVSDGSIENNIVTVTNDTSPTLVQTNMEEDTTPPMVTVNGNNPAEITVGASYNDLGAAVTDNVDDNLGIKASVNGVDVGDISNISIDTSTSGIHSIMYFATDSQGNIGTAERLVIVGGGDNAPPTEIVEEVIADTTPPVITYLGEETIELTVGDTYVDAGATATDDIDGDLTANIIVHNSVNTTTVGLYTVTYNVSDSAENAALQITRTVIVSS